MASVSRLICPGCVARCVLCGARERECDFAFCPMLCARHSPRKKRAPRRQVGLSLWSMLSEPNPNVAKEHELAKAHATGLLGPLNDPLRSNSAATSTAVFMLSDERLFHNVSVLHTMARHPMSVKVPQSSFYIGDSRSFFDIGIVILR